MHFSISKLSLYKNIVRVFSSPQFVSLMHRTITILIYIVALWLLFLILGKLIKMIRHLKEPYAFLEITPPQDTKVMPLSNTQLFNLIMGLLEQRSWRDRLTLRQISASFEIVSRKETGIQYIIRVPESYSSSFEKTLRAYLPDLQIKKTADYLTPDDKQTSYKTLDFGLAKHFALPLNEQSDLNKHDPLAYLTANMTRLKKDELLALQIVLKPLVFSDRKSLRRETVKLKNVLRRNKYIDWLNNSSAQQIASVFVGVLELLTQVAMTPLLFIAEFITGNKVEYPAKSSTTAIATPADIEFSELAKAKLNEPLFEAGIRALLVIEKDQLAEREKGLRASFMSYRHTCGQALVARRNHFGSLSQRLKLWKFRTRSSGLLVLSSSEIGALYHFPFATEVQNEDLSRVRSRELPAPLSFKKDDANLDIVLGTNDYAGNKTQIGVTLEQRRKHMYVIGKTGTGKTTLLTSAIYQDMVNGKGLAVFDPHGDMFHELLGLVPEHRKKDVMVFDPSDRQWPIGLNILSPGVKFQDKEDEEEWIASSVIEVFKKITGEILILHFGSKGKVI